MQTLAVKVNLNNLKKFIQSDYLRYRDILYRILISHIYIYNYTIKQISSNIIFEEQPYQELLSSLLMSGTDIRNVLDKMNIEHYSPLYIDVSLYIDEFLSYCYKEQGKNIVSLRLTDDGYVVVENKHFRLHPTRGMNCQLQF